MDHRRGALVAAALGLLGTTGALSSATARGEGFTVGYDRFARFGAPMQVEIELHGGEGMRNVAISREWLGKFTVDASVPEPDSARLPARELAVLRRVPLFAGLPGPVLENLAFHAIPVRLAAGDVLMRQGDRGDRYYAIASGQLDVWVDGVEVAHQGPGGGVGEIALLRAVPRSATVAAIEDAELLAIEREPFLAAMTGHAAALEDANAIVAGHMARTAVVRRAA